MAKINFKNSLIFVEKEKINRKRRNVRMSKMLNIALVDVDGPLHMPAYCMDWSTLSEEECSNILHAMNFHHPTEEEAYNAINTLLAYLYYENKAGTFVDVSVMNNQKPKNTKEEEK